MKNPWIRRRHVRGLVVLLMLTSVVACAAPASSATQAAPTSYEEYRVAACSAWDALFRAVGNPDTGTGSDLSRALDQAVAARDPASADRLAVEIENELAAGRGHVAIAGGWLPRADAMIQLDRVFVAFEAMTDAKRQAARGEPNAVDPQAALEAAGGIDAWFALMEAMRASTGVTDQPCPNVPVTP